jgi:hypothetical protein
MARRANGSFFKREGKRCLRFGLPYKVFWVRIVDRPEPFFKKKLKIKKRYSQILFTKFNLRYCYVEKL